jgi:hypothetical protein
MIDVIILDVIWEERRTKQFSTILASEIWICYND